jgi:DNA-binding response OmpR family regulator
MIARDQLVTAPRSMEAVGHRILLVEDDPMLRTTLADTLSAHGYGVRALGDARALVETVSTEGLSLVILDVMLPGIDGLTACRALRTAGLDVPVMILSARSGDMDKIVGLEAGADDYLTKPFSTGEGRRATLDGEELRLTQKEFNVLAELLRNRGVVLSRDLLLERIWGYDYIGDSRTVDVHVRWLRQKIEADPSNPVRITTVRGVGYRFDG